VQRERLSHGAQACEEARGPPRRERRPCEGPQGRRGCIPMSPRPRPTDTRLERVQRLQAFRGRDKP